MPETKYTRFYLLKMGDQPLFSSKEQDNNLTVRTRDTSCNTKTCIQKTKMWGSASITCRIDPIIERHENIQCVFVDQSTRGDKMILSSEAKCCWVDQIKWDFMKGCIWDQLKVAREGPRAQPLHTLAHHTCEQSLGLDWVRSPWSHTKDNTSLWRDVTF